MMTEEFKRGVKAAADIADSYNETSTHKYRLGDCIALKLNAVARNKPRINRKALSNPNDAFMRGVIVALTEVRRHGLDNSSIRRIAHELGVTLEFAREIECSAYDLRALKRAGVK